MTPQATVSAGDFYSQKLKHWDTQYLVWRVKSVSNTAMDLPHAQLINIRDPFETRTISCRVLTDATFYERLEGHAADRPATASAKVSELKRFRAEAVAAGAGRQP